MPFYDFSRPELEAYKPAREEPADFDAFWQNTLAEVRQHPLAADREGQDRHQCGSLRMVVRPQ